MAEGKKHKATVVVFLSFNCPISNRYIPVLGDLASKHAKNDVIFIGIPDQNDPAEVKKLALEFKASFPMHYDPENKVADAFLAKTSPEAFLLDSNLTLRYFGAIDDQYADRTTRLPQARTRHLDEAIQAVVDGKGVPVKHAAANG
ncbi:MAG: redoxin domain-containing protein, partial [Planctomycetes bacterium]|nr:redoxin domain-containing protein [Planctomycetota bacterium]